MEEKAPSSRWAVLQCQWATGRQGECLITNLREESLYVIPAKLDRVVSGRPGRPRLSNPTRKTPYGPRRGRTAFQSFIQLANEPGHRR